MDGYWTEVSHLVFESEAASGAKDATVNTNHHEHTASTAGFPGETRQTNQALEDMGNPFQEESSDLLSLDIKGIAQPSIHELLSNTMREVLRDFMNLWRD